MKPGLVHGSPGSRLSVDNARLDQGAVAAGVAGERRTAAILNELTEQGVHVFHSLQVPGSKFGDVDHVLVSGKRLILVDSKSRKPGIYRGWFGRIYNGTKRDKGLSPDSSLRFVQAFRLAGFRVGKPIILIHGKADLRIHSRRVKYVSSRNWDASSLKLKPSDAGVVARLERFVDTKIGRAA